MFFVSFCALHHLRQANVGATRRPTACRLAHFRYEGPHTIAAILVESITGTNGVLPPPPGYLEGLRALCDRYGIMLICDEVMAGFGRSGKLFGFCHAPTVVPDLFTFAKGVNGAVLPLAGIGMRDHLAEHFRKTPHMVGSTYHSHPVALASGYAALKVMLRDGLVENAARLGPVMTECMDELLARHPSVKQARNRGLFGAFDVQRDRSGTFIGEVDAPLDPAMVAFKTKLCVPPVPGCLFRDETVALLPPRRGDIPRPRALFICHHCEPRALARPAR